MQRDIVLWTTSNLSGPWSAGEISGSLTSDMLKDMANAFDRMEPLVRVRLLIACAFLPPHRRSELGDELRALAQKASGDDHEWVRLYGTALAEADGKLHMENTFPLVQQTLRDLEERLQSHDDTASLLRPLEEPYLSERLLSRRGVSTSDDLAHSDFTLSHDVDVQGFSGSKQSSFAPSLAAASFASRYSHEHTGPPGAGAAARRKEDSEESMFVKISHKFKAPSQLPVAVGASSKMKVLESTELPGLKPGTALKRRVPITSQDSDAAAKRRELGGGATDGRLVPGDLLGASAEHGMTPLPHFDGDAYTLAPTPGLGTSSHNNEPAPNTF